MNPAPTPSPPPLLPPLLTVADVLKFVPVSERALWSMVSAGEFPAPKSVPKRPRLWRGKDVQKWIDQP